MMPRTLKAVKAVSKTLLCGAVAASLSISAVAQSASLDAVPARKPDDIARLCFQLDYSGMVAAGDLSGLMSWRGLCMRQLETTNDTKTLPRLALAEIYTGVIVHRYVRREADRNVRGTDMNADFFDPQQNIDMAEKLIGLAKRFGQKTDDIAPLLADAKATLARPATNPQLIETDEQSCIMDRMNIGDNQNLVRLASACQRAYNRRPLGIFARQYAKSVFYMTKMMLINDPNNVEGYKGALIAKDFYKRANDEGWGDDTVWPGLTDNLVSSYRARIDQKNLEKFVIGAFALGVILAIINGGGKSSTGGGFRFGGTPSDDDYYTRMHTPGTDQYNFGILEWQKRRDEEFKVYHSPN